MNQPKTIQISVPQPCRENWDKMTPQQQGRFCDSCQKCVIDFTTFSDEAIYKYMTSHVGKKICGRFNSSQLNRPINIPHQPQSQLYKWIIAAGLALVCIGTPNTDAFAQAPIQQEQCFTPPDSTHTKGRRTASNKQNQNKKAECKKDNTTLSIGMAAVDTSMLYIIDGMIVTYERDSSLKIMMQTNPKAVHTLNILITKENDN